MGDGGGSTFFELICSTFLSIDKLVRPSMDGINNPSIIPIQTSFIPSITFPVLQGSAIAFLSWIGMGSIFQSVITGEYQKQIPKSNRAITAGIFFITTTVISLSKDKRSHIVSNLPILNDLNKLIRKRRDDFVIERVLECWKTLDDVIDEGKFIYNDILKKWKPSK